MDIAAPLKGETIRPFMSIAVPGIIAVAPYALVLGYYFPIVKSVWSDHPATFGLLFAAIVAAVGTTLGDIGEQIEVLCWDKKLQKTNPNHLKEWHAYLQLKLKDEIIAQRFLQTKLTHFKFELAMPPSLVLSWAGLFWYNLLRHTFSTVAFAGLTVFIFAVAVYLAWESWKTAEALAESRRLILEALSQSSSTT